MNGGIIEQNPACHVASPLVRSNHCLYIHIIGQVGNLLSRLVNQLGGDFFHLRLLALHWILDLGSIGGPGAQGQILLGLHLGCTYNPRCRNYHLNRPKLGMSWRNLRPSDLLYVLQINVRYICYESMTYVAHCSCRQQSATIIKADISKLIRPPISIKIWLSALDNIKCLS